MSSSLDLGSADVFLWLLCRLRDNAAIDTDTRLDRIDRLAGTDSSKRLTALTKGVDFDRPAFLVAVAEVDQLGPARLKLIDKPLKARFMFDLSANGSFKLITSQSGYRGLPKDDKMRWDAVHDLAFNLIPKLNAVYRADRTWSASKRDAEIRSAVDALIARYQSRLITAP